MREIKFRVWTGDSYEYNIMAGFLGAFYVSGIDENDSASMSSANTKYDDCPVEQFTGLKDKNGKDIYEGDILRDGKGGDGIVVYNENTASFYMFADDDYFHLNEHTLNRPTRLQYTEIVGNIHEK